MSLKLDESAGNVPLIPIIGHGGSPIPIWPQPLDWALFVHNVRTASGVDLSGYRQEQLVRRVVGIMESMHIESLTELWGALATDSVELRRFLDHIAVNVSSLFRDPERWEELRAHVLPQLLAERSVLDCWSAGCSYGAEAYSLATLLAETGKAPHRILGTDIDTSALAQAQRGEFTAADMQQAPPELRQAYFEQAGATFRAKIALRPYLTFRRHNLLGEGLGKTFDLILCRNVLIYFTPEARTRVLTQLAAALRPHGVLFVGQTERLPEPEIAGLHAELPHFYRRTAESIPHAQAA